MEENTYMLPSEKLIKIVKQIISFYHFYCFMFKFCNEEIQKKKKNRAGNKEIYSLFTKSNTVIMILM